MSFVDKNLEEESAGQNMADTDENFLELIEIPEVDLNITEYNPEYTLLNDRSPKSSSDVWKHFGTLKYNDMIDRNHVYCIQCFDKQRIKKYQRSTSTGNLSKHLKTVHGISLIQPYRIRKEADDSIVSIVPEQIDDIKSLNKSTDSNEYIVCDLNEILIGEVEKRPALYNSTVQQQKGQKHQTRRQLWAEIHNSMHQTIPLARLPKIWKNIRDRYYKVRRCVESTSESGYKPRYRYYDMLRFLDDVKVERQKEGAADGVDYEIYFDGENEQEAEIDSLYESDKDKDEPAIEEMESDVLPSDGKTVQKDHDPVKQITESVQKTESPKRSASDDGRTKTDEFDDFASFVAKVMRKMTKSQSRKLQVNIMNLISEIEDD